LSKKYKNWDKSPEAYFLTKAERAQWKQVKTDADAQNFILDYKAKRGPEFPKMLEDRIAVADKYFSSGETKGSETLRGKVVIVLGPPSSIEKEKGESGNKTDVTRTDNFSSGRGGVEMSSAGTSSPMSPHANAPQTPVFTFVYNKETAPKPIGKAFRVELKMFTNADQEPEDPQGLEAAFEAMAEASIASSEPAKEPRQP
ncbi:MAG: GWxTD domain-containing protein, partial [Thermoanaerobaculia bacterium]